MREQHTYCGFHFQQLVRERIAHAASPVQDQRALALDIHFFGRTRRRRRQRSGRAVALPGTLEEGQGAGRPPTLARIVQRTTHFPIRGTYNPRSYYPYVYTVCLGESTQSMYIFECLDEL